MTALAFLPNRNCVHIGPETIPLNLPAHLPVDVRHWIAQVVALTTPETISWPDPSTVGGRSCGLGAAATGPATVYLCSAPAGRGVADRTWRDPTAMRTQLLTAFDGCMRRSALYVVPFLIGERAGIQLTDSAQVARAQWSVSTSAVQALQRRHGQWLAVVHSARRLPTSEPDGPFVALFPESGEVWANGCVPSPDLLPTLADDQLNRSGRR